MQTRNSPANPRLALLRREVEQTVLKPFRSHGWATQIVRETDRDDCIEITAGRGKVTTRIGVLYGSAAITKTGYSELSKRVEHIFFSGRPYRLDSFAAGASVPVASLDDFFPFLVDLNKRVEPDRSLPVVPRRPATVRRLTAENPLEAVVARLRQFTSEALAGRLVERRAAAEEIGLEAPIIATKATGVARSMRSALDFFAPKLRDTLNRRILGLYYATMAFAQAEMLVSPKGPTDLDEVEGMTKRGHGLYALPGPDGGFADFHVGVLASGFLPQWMHFLEHDTSDYPKAKPKSPADLNTVPTSMACPLRDLFACMPEIDDLVAEVFDGPPGWIAVAYDQNANTGCVDGTQRQRGPAVLMGCSLIARGKFPRRGSRVPAGRSRKSSEWMTTRAREVHFAPASITPATTSGGRCFLPIPRRSRTAPRSFFQLWAVFGRTGQTPQSRCTRSRSWCATCRARGGVSKGETKIAISLS